MSTLNHEESTDGMGVRMQKIFDPVTWTTENMKIW